MLQLQLLALLVVRQYVACESLPLIVLACREMHLATRAVPLLCVSIQSIAYIASCAATLGTETCRFSTHLGGGKPYVARSSHDYLIAFR